MNLPVNGRPDEWSGEKIAKKRKGILIRLFWKKQHQKYITVTLANHNQCICLPHMAAYLILSVFLCQSVKVTGPAGDSLTFDNSHNHYDVCYQKSQELLCDCALLIKGIWPSSSGNNTRKHPCVCSAFHWIATGASLALCHSSSDINHST